MSKIESDLKTWGERLFYPEENRKVGRINYRLYKGGSSTNSIKNNNKRINSSGSGGGSGGGNKKRTDRIRNKLLGIVKNHPEVMVKITSSCKGSSSLKAHIEYISRDGELPLTNEKGDQITEKMSKETLLENWEGEIPDLSRQEEKERGKRETFNIIFSMPAGTKREAVNSAAEETIKELFENHQYYFAAHDDTPNPHVHVSVKAIDRFGKRLNPRKKDLQIWREKFAEKLTERGIDAKATSRATRAELEKGDKTSTMRKKMRGEDLDVALERRLTVINAAKNNEPLHDSDAVTKAKKTRYAVTKVYGEIINTLGNSDNEEDKLLAKQLKQYVEKFKPIIPKDQATYNLVKQELSRANKLKKEIIHDSQEKGRVSESISAAVPKNKADRDNQR